MTYYDDIADGYDSLHKEEQLKKLALIKSLHLIRDNDIVLDVGCGTGFSLDYFIPTLVVGIDPAEKLVDQYKGSQQIFVGRAEQLPFEDGEFNVVISITAIQNFKDIEKSLSEIKRVGDDRFILTVLKASLRLSEVREFLPKIFVGFSIEEIEEEKDIIFVVKK